MATPPASSSDVGSFMFDGNFVNGSSILARRRALLDAGLFDPQMRYHADGNMWLRMLKLGPFSHIPEVLLKYRVHPGAASRNLHEMRRYRYLYFDKIWETYGLDEIVADGCNPDAFLTEALIANGLFDRAWQRIRRRGGNPRLLLRLAGAWSADRVRRGTNAHR